MDLEIKHRSGGSNAGADALSRTPGDATTVNTVKTDSAVPTDLTHQTDSTDDDSSDISPLKFSEASQQKL